MSLVDDQIRNDSENALDELSKRVNKEKNPIRAAEALLKFETDLERAQKKTKETVEPGKTVINPEELLRGIQEDMTR